MVWSVFAPVPYQQPGWFGVMMAEKQPPQPQDPRSQSFPFWVNVMFALVWAAVRQAAWYWSAVVPAASAMVD